MSDDLISRKDVCLNELLEMALQLLLDWTSILENY